MDSSESCGDVVESSESWSADSETDIAGPSGCCRSSSVPALLSSASSSAIRSQSRSGGTEDMPILITESPVKLDSKPIYISSSDMSTDSPMKIERKHVPAMGEKWSKRKLTFRDPSSDSSTSDSSSNSDTDDFQEELYNSDPKTPVYQWSTKRGQYTIEQLARVLVLEDVEPHKVCSGTPMNISHNVAFVVNLEEVGGVGDLKADEMGVWNRQGSPKAYISIREKGSKKEVIRRHRTMDLPHHYTITRTYYRSGSSPDLQKLLVTAEDHNKKTLKLAFVQYSFDATEHSIELKPHQNAKGSGMPPYRRQKKSTMEKLDSAVRETKSATRAVKKVYQESGGIQNVRSGSELPRNVQQAHYLKKKQEVQSKPTASRNADTLAAIMHQCKETSTGPHAYIRAVQAAPEPVCVLATDQQINDLVRFCTNPDHFSVLTVDPTFNLGPFNVTPMTYENLLVTNKDGKHPLLLGPVLIHQTKTLSPFHLFASTLISLNSKVAEVKAFGSDGEPELIKAFSLAFRNAVQLRCFSHFRQNIKDKLREIGMPQSATKKIIEDIFGRQIGSHFEEGLVDAEDDVTFLAMLNSLEIEWNNLEKGSIQQKSVPSFFSWFKQYKATTVAQTMLRCVRQKANLGSPPCKFTTNHSESINNVIKMEVEWKESQLPQLIEKLNDIHTRQMQNVEMAILKRGEWRLSQKFQHLEQDENKWFTKLTHEGRRRHIKKVMECSVAKNEATQQSNILPLTPEATGITTVALSTLEAIWQKAQKLISSPGHILNAAWSPNPRARLVASSRSQSPHLVTTDDKEPAKYICDGNCPMFQGFGICAHIVAAAHHNRQLQLFVEWYVQTKCTPNLTVISRQGLPQGAGRKGGVPKRKRTKKQTKIESRSKRVNVSDQPASVCPPPSMATAVTYSSSVTTATTSCPPTLSQTMTPSTNPAQQIYSHGGSMYFPQVTPSCTATYTQIQSPPPVYFPAQVRRPPPPLLSIHQSPASCSSWRLPSVNPFPWRPQLPPTVTTYNMQQTNRNPFFVKFLTKQIKVCQGCRKQFHDENTHPPRDVIIARLERRIVSNPSTGAQVLTKESPSHYHPRLCCIHMVCPSFQKTNLVVPQELSLRLTAAHRVYLDDCLKD